MPGTCTPSLRKSHSLNILDSIKAADNVLAKYDVDFPLQQASFVAPPPQPLYTTKNLILTVSANDRILAATNDLCTMLEFSMAELQDRSLRIMFGPETDMSAIASALKTVHMAVEHRATIPSVQIYARSGSCRLFDIHCALEESGDQDSLVIMRFISVQQNQYPVARSSRRNSVTALHREARSWYNFITGLGLHASSVESSMLGIV